MHPLTATITNVPDVILAGICLLGAAIFLVLLATKRHNKNVTLLCLCALPAFILTGVIFAVVGFGHIG